MRHPFDLIAQAAPFLPSRLRAVCAALGEKGVVAFCLLAAGVGTLMAVFYYQYVLFVPPCVLCSYQRVPFYVAAFIGAYLLVREASATRMRALLAFQGSFFLVNIGVAFYHMGVEHHWWPGTDKCGVPVSQALSLDQINAALSLPMIVPCDDVTWSMFGYGWITLAVMNLFGSSVMASFCFMAFLRAKKWQTS